MAEGGLRITRWSPLLRRRSAAPQEQTREELIAELREGGFLEQELRLTDKSRALLDADPTTMDDYLYWCVHIHARKAQALVEGRDINRAAIGGPQTDEERRSMTSAIFGPEA
jgi:hypothetical protein